MGWQIAIDGPAGAGKSTIAKIIAQKLNMIYIDTGAMYRAAALKALQLNIDLKNEEEYKFLYDTSISFNEEGHVLLDGVDVSSNIRTMEISNAASFASTFGLVRTRLVSEQQKIASDHNVIMDGRDIGTVVLKNANLKIFLTASLEERTKRRMLERKEKHQEEFSFEETMKEIDARDYQDSHRAISPLTKADDAVEIDTSNLSIEDVINKIIGLVSERGYRMENLEQNLEQKQEELVKEEEAKETNDALDVAPVEEAPVEEAPAEEAPAEEAPEETPAEETAEEALEEAPADAKAKYHELQVVIGTVVKIIPAKPETKRGDKVFPAREEKALIELEDGTQGYLSVKDEAELQEGEELFDKYIEGDEVEVAIKRIFPDGGKLVFSTALVAKKHKLEALEEFVNSRPVIKVKVIKNVEVGLLTKYEEFSCLIPKKPKSLLSLTDEEIEGLIGKEIEVVPVRIDYSRIRIICNQTAALQQKAKAEKKEFLAQLAEGQVYDGVVKNIETYGAFVDIGYGVEGLLHISEIDHNRVFKVEKVLNVGDSVKVQIIKLEKDHIGLSRKALIPNYFGDFIKANEVGALVSGKVNDIRDAGVTVELAENVNGFLPKSEYSWDNDAVIADEVKVGDTLEAKVIEIDANKKRIILSKKQLTENPWEKVTVKAGDVVEVTVLKPLDNGFKVQLGEVTGYLPKGSIRSRSADSVQVGEVLKVKVKILDTNRGRLVVNLNDAEERVERENYSKYLKQQDKISNTLGDYLKDRK